MNTENQIDPNVPAPGETDGSDLRGTIGWIINVALKAGVGYLARVILQALGF